MRKAELVREISRKTGIEIVTSETIIETLQQSIKDHISNKGTIFIRGFGTFTIRRRAAKKVRDIRKNKPMLLPACYIPIFKPSKKFKGMVKKKTSI
jgi:DNA-binding protein HU-beta